MRNVKYGMFNGLHAQTFVQQTERTLSGNADNMLEDYLAPDCSFGGGYRIFWLFVNSFGFLDKLGVLERKIADALTSQLLPVVVC
ncbi:MAG TPA: hypothetical protein VKB46_05220 [Pyrinomonadaceae bacterium]|nr:hypothetical protein [Pyrinomonadaceae bacterium]